MRFFLLLLLASCGGEISTNDGGTKIDAGAAGDAGDAGVCIDVEPSQFDTSCDASTDCVPIAAGTFCAGYNCSCPGATINAASQSDYASLIATVPHGPGICSCPFLGSPRCIASQCVFCPNPAMHPSTLPPGCPKNECEQAGGTCKPVSQNQCMGGGAPIGPYDCDAGDGCCQ